MEPLSGPGVAHSIIQLVSMLEEVVIKCRESFSTSRTKDNASIAIVSMLQELSNMGDLLRHQLHEHLESRSKYNELLINDIDRCDSICQGLQIALARLHDERGGQQMSRATSTLVWEGQDSNDHERSLRRIRLHLSSFLNPNIKSQHGSIGIPLQALDAISSPLKIDGFGKLPQSLQGERQGEQDNSAVNNTRETYESGINTHTPCVSNFTESDTRQYIQRTLEGISWFKARKGSDPGGYVEVVEHILEKSNRSFAWIDLAISGALDSTNHLDRIYDFLTKLRLLPTDPDTLFLRILDGVEAKYHQEQAHILLIASQNDEPLNILAYSFLDELEEMPDYVLEAMAAPMSQELADQKCKSMKKRIIGGCKSLLDVILNDQGEECVTFLHRSVRDYLRATRGQEILLSRLKHAFDPGREICSILLAQIKFHRIGPVWDIGGSVNGLVSQFLRGARKYEVSTGRTLGYHINELETTIQKRKGPTFWWWQSRSVTKGEITVTFLELIMQHRLVEYLKWRFETCPTLAPSQLAMANLLESALIPLSERLLDSRIVKVLLDHGANPNHPSDHGYHVDSRPTTWRLFLLHLHRSARKQDSVESESDQQISFAIEYLIRAGADLSCLLRPVPKEGNQINAQPTINVVDIISTYVSPGDAAYLLRVVEDRKLQDSSRFGWLGWK